MRLAPVPLFFVHNAHLAIDLSGESSRTTHGSRICVDACRYYGGLIVGALHGESKERLVSPFYRPGTVPWQDDELRNEISSVAAGSWNREPPDIVGSGYVAKSLEAALWAFARAQSFGEGCLMAVNLGDDADTTGAIYGQLAGAYFGASGIPAAWLEALVHRDLIERLALDLLEQGHQLEEEV
jgi:ADP-ribosylglycohydrolase